MSSQTGYFDVFNGWDGTVPLPWKMQAGLFWTVEQPADGYLSHANFAGYTGDTGISVGICDADLNQQCISSGSDQQAFAPNNRSSRAIFTDRTIVVGRGPDVSLSSEYLILAEVDKCGLTFSMTGTSSYRVYYLVFAGATLNTATGTVGLLGDGSDGVVTGLPFDPSADPSLLITAFGSNTDNTGPCFVSLGFATSPPGEQSLWTVIYNDRGGTASGAAGINEGIGSVVSFASFDASGFTLNHSAALGVNLVLPYLLLTDSAGSFHVGAAAWPSGAGSVSAPGFRPEAALFHDYISNEEAIGGQITLGAAGGDTNAALAGVANVNDQRRWTAQESSTGDVLLDYVGNTGVQSGNVGFNGFTSSGFDWDGTASGFAGDVRYAAIGLSSASRANRCRGGALPVLGVG